MKVGIQTWFYGANYGAKAQSYALQKTVESLGFDVKMINYRTKGYQRVNKQMNENYDQLRKHPIRLYSCRKRVKILDRANEKYNLTASVHNAHEINLLNLDAIIYGSDAIFNVGHPLFNDIYMGVGVDTTKIGYSPSCENLSPNFRLSAKQIESIKEFTDIAVRDVNTQYLLKENCNIETRITLDPTLLYDFVEIGAGWEHEDYVLVYSFSSWNQYAEEIKEFANKRGKKVLSVGRYCDWADINIDTASFEEWITSFRRASYVFTDSFHGTVFALKNSKQIILVCRDDKKAKIMSLLSNFAVNLNFYCGGNIEDYLSNNSINYDSVNRNIELIRLESINYLKSALRKVK